MSRNSQNHKSTLLTWGGVLTLAAVAVTLALVFTGRLALYIHPRYLVFTTAMAVLAGVVMIIAASPGARTAQAEPSAHDHADGDPHPENQRSARGRILSIGTAVISGTLLLPLVVFPPASLSVERSIATGDAGGPARGAPGGEAPENVADFTFADWSSALRAGASAADLTGASPTLVGFVTEDPDDPDIMVLTRYTITCCVVDAQPATVPVYLPDWSSQFEAGDWVEVSGYFANNPSVLSDASTAFIPTETAPTSEPKVPYITVSVS